MSVIIRLQNLPWSANSFDIRQYFRGLSIPEGGVHIVGGEMGDAFIAFSTDEDARQAMLRSGGRLKEVQVVLMLSSRTEMQQVVERARAGTLQPIPSASIVPAVASNQQQLPTDRVDSRESSYAEGGRTSLRSRSRSRSRGRDRGERDDRDRSRGYRDRRRRSSRSRSRSPDRDRRDHRERDRDRRRRNSRSRSHGRDRFGRDIERRDEFKKDKDTSRDGIENIERIKDHVGPVIQTQEPSKPSESMNAPKEDPLTVAMRKTLSAINVPIPDNLLASSEPLSLGNKNSTPFNERKDEKMDRRSGPMPQEMAGIGNNTGYPDIIPPFYQGFNASMDRMPNPGNPINQQMNEMWNMPRGNFNNFPGAAGNYNMGMGPGMNAGMNPGMNPGMNSGMNPGMNSGMNPGMNSGMNMNMGYGMPMGPNPGMGNNMGNMPNAPMNMGMGMNMGMPTNSNQMKNNNAPPPSKIVDRCPEFEDYDTSNGPDEFRSRFITNSNGGRPIGANRFQRPPDEPPKAKRPSRFSDPDPRELVNKGGIARDNYEPDFARPDRIQRPFNRQRDENVSHSPRFDDGPTGDRTIPPFQRGNRRDESDDFERNFRKDELSPPNRFQRPNMPENAPNRPLRFPEREQDSQRITNEEGCPPEHERRPVDLSSELCVELIGCPKAPYSVFRRALKSCGLAVRDIKFDNTSDIRRVGIMFITKYNKDNALKKSKIHINGDTVTVKHLPQEEFEKFGDEMDKSVERVEQELSDRHIRVRDLPESMTADELTNMLTDVSVVKVCLTAAPNRSITAYIKFPTENDATKAISILKDYRYKTDSVSVAEFIEGSQREIKIPQPTPSSRDAPKLGFKGDELTKSLKPIAETFPVNHLNSPCLLIDKLPLNVSDRDICDFFSDIGIVPSAIHIMLNGEGRPSGEAYVEFPTVESATRALTKNGAPFRRQTLSITIVSREQMIDAVEGPEPAPQPLMHMRPGPNIPNRCQPPPECVVTLDNVPFLAQSDEILQFFGRSFEIGPKDVFRKLNDRGQNTGAARVIMPNANEARRAVATLNNKRIRGRIIQVGTLDSQ